jgi:hypothetical protein
VLIICGYRNETSGYHIREVLSVMLLQADFNDNAKINIRAIQSKFHCLRHNYSEEF